MGWAPAAVDTSATSRAGIDCQNPVGSSGNSASEPAMAQQYDPMAEMWSGDVFGKLAAHPDTRRHLGDQSFISTIEGIIADPSSVKLFMQVWLVHACW